jgi:hypothetical protein
MWCQFQQREFLSLKDESESGRVIHTFSSFRDEKVFFILRTSAWEKTVKGGDRCGEKTD